MKTHSPTPPTRAGFTLVEVMISLTIVVLVMALTLSTFLFGIRMMYKNNERLATNTTLRYFMAQMSKATLDASEFYIYPSYATLDGTVNSMGDLTTSMTDSYGLDLYHGDCLVLVTRTSLEDGANIRRITIYYRTTADPDKEGAIRYYEGKDYGTSGTTDTLDTLLSAINLKAAPNYPGSKLLAARTYGRAKADGHRYPIFSSKAPVLGTENESVAVNVEVVNGSDINNLLSSSSFNYTISPRR
jgi:prepilin-type N-terminal cleavage/methylation domain-containing protein